jgi:quercetin dioxygenase-like cupin family protein
MNAMKKSSKTSSNHVSLDQETGHDSTLFALLSEQLSDIPQSKPLLNKLEQKLAQRIQSSIAKHTGVRTVRSRDGYWKNLMPGIRYKTLWQSDLGNSVLIDFTPGASLPIHKHNYLEEGIVLSGSLNIDELVLKQFDYHVSPSGSHHGKIWSKDGGMAFLRGSSVGGKFSMLKEVLGGLLPKNQLASTSIRSGENDWVEVQPGVSRKVMWDDGEFVSQFFRLEPDATIKAHGHPQDEECMMLSGELFLGDILLQAGDYQLASKGSQHLDIYTDVGALFYVRAAVN